LLGAHAVEVFVGRGDSAFDDATRARVAVDLAFVTA